MAQSVCLSKKVRGRALHGRAHRMGKRHCRSLAAQQVRSVKRAKRQVEDNERVLDEFSAQQQQQQQFRTKTRGGSPTRHVLPPWRRPPEQNGGHTGESSGRKIDEASADSQSDGAVPAISTAMAASDAASVRVTESRDDGGGYHARPPPGAAAGQGAARAQGERAGNGVSVAQRTPLAGPRGGVSARREVEGV